jgi:hypothetical protein
MNFHEIHPRVAYDLAPNFSHVTIVFIAKYLFIGSVKILNKIVYKIAIKFISMRKIRETDYKLNPPNNLDRYDVFKID